MFVTDKCKLEFLARYAFKTVRTCKYLVSWDDTCPPPSILFLILYCNVVSVSRVWCPCPTFVSNLYSQWLSDALKTPNKTLSLSSFLEERKLFTVQYHRSLMSFWKIRENESGFNSFCRCGLPQREDPDPLVQFVNVPVSSSKRSKISRRGLLLVAFTTDSFKEAHKKRVNIHTHTPVDCLGYFWGPTLPLSVATTDKKIAIRT